MIQVNRIYLIFNLVHFLVDSSEMYNKIMDTTNQNQYPLAFFSLRKTGGANSFEVSD